MEQLTTTTVTIFYSWQSDTRFNRKAILDALRQAISEVERKFGVHIKIEEATSNETGSPHIPNTILQKISKSDIFIGDLSVVGAVFNGDKKLANPNVLLELGYAVSELTWNRVILLFNKNFGKFPNELPFDIEKRRCLDFNVTIENDTNGIGLLRTELIARISEILTLNPVRNILSRNQVEIQRREKDIKVLESILNLFRLKMMDHLFKDGYARVSTEVVKKAKMLSEIVSSKQFFLFDEAVKEKLVAFHDKLSMFIKFVEADYKKERYDSYSYENKAIKSSHLPNRFDNAKLKVKELDDSFTSLLVHVRVNYHEIDIDTFIDYEDDEE